MRVCIVVGGKFHSLALAQQLHKRGYLERLIITRPEIARKLGNNAVSIPLPEYLGKVWSVIPFVNRIIPYNYIKDNLFDLLAKRHIKSCDVFVGWAHFALYSMRVARTLGAKLVIERGSAHILVQNQILAQEYRRLGIPYTPVHRLLISKQLKEYEEADFIVVPSEFARDSFLSQGVDAEKLIVIPYGVDTRMFRPQEKQDKTFRILFVGAVSIEKGVHYLLQAVSELKLKDSEVLLIGRINTLMKSILAQYRDMFEHINYVPQQKLRQYYANASVFVLPSLHEGSALVTYEAMACGLPLIVTRNAGSVMKDGIHGFIVPVGDVEAIKEKILYLYEHEEERIAMGHAAREYVVENFTWDHYGERVVRAYQTILGLG